MAGKRKELTPEEVLAKEQEDLDAIENLKFEHHAAFDEEGKVKAVSNIIVEPRDVDLLAYCPFLTEIKIAQKYAGYFSAYFKYKPVPIANINWAESNYIYICGLMINKNLRDVFETQTSKGKSLGTVEDMKKTMKNPELTSFANFDVLDETEQIKCNISRFKFPEYKDEIFLSSAQEVFLIYGRNGTTFRSVSVNKIIKLEPFLKKLMAYENLNKDEIEVLRDDLKKKYIMDPEHKGEWKYIYKEQAQQALAQAQQAAPVARATPASTSGARAFQNPFGL